jgi:hypothetical protein
LMADVSPVMVVLRNGRNTLNKHAPPLRRGAKTPAVKKSRPRATKKKAAPKKKPKSKATFARPETPLSDRDLIVVQRVSQAGWLKRHATWLTRVFSQHVPKVRDAADVSSDASSDHSTVNQIDSDEESDRDGSVEVTTAGVFKWLMSRVTDVSFTCRRMPR